MCCSQRKQLATSGSEGGRHSAGRVAGSVDRVRFGRIDTRQIVGRGLRGSGGSNIGLAQLFECTLGLTVY